MDWLRVMNKRIFLFLHVLVTSLCGQFSLQKTNGLSSLLSGQDTSNFYYVMPQAGAFWVESKSLTRMWQSNIKDHCHDTLRLLFNKTDAEENISISQINNGILKKITPFMWGSLLGLIESGNIETIEAEPFYALFKMKSDEKKKIKKLQLHTLLQNLYKECVAEKKYLSIFPSMLFSSLAYFSCHTTEDIKEYLKGIKSQWQAFPLHENIDKIEIKSFTENNLKEAIVAFENNEKILDEIKRNPDLSAYSLYENLLFSPIMPKPMPQSFQFSFCHQSSFSTCGETTIMELCNIIFWDKKKNQFSLSMIPKEAQEKLLPEFAKFYTEIFPSQNSISPIKAMNIFFNIISGIVDKDIEYAHIQKEPKLNYEIEPLQSNIVAVFNYLFGTKFENLLQFNEYFSVPERTLTFKESENTSSGDLIDELIDLTVHYPKSDEQATAKIKITNKKHMEIEYQTTKEFKGLPAQYLFPFLIHTILNETNTNKWEQAIVPSLLTENVSYDPDGIHIQQESNRINDLYDVIKKQKNALQIFYYIYILYPKIAVHLLCKAYKNNDTEVVKYLLNLGVSGAHTRFSHNDTFILALKNEDFSTIETLLKNGYDAFAGTGLYFFINTEIAESPFREKVFKEILSYYIKINNAEIISNFLNDIIHVEPISIKELLYVFKTIPHSSTIFMTEEVIFQKTLNLTLLNKNKDSIQLFEFIAEKIKEDKDFPQGLINLDAFNELIQALKKLNFQDFRIISILKPLKNLYISNNKITFDDFYINKLLNTYEAELLKDKESLSFLLSLIDKPEDKKSTMRAKIIKSFNTNNFPLFKTFISHLEKEKSYNNLFCQVLNLILFNTNSVDLLHTLMEEMLTDEDLRITLEVDFESLKLFHSEIKKNQSSDFFIKTILDVFYTPNNSFNLTNYQIEHLLEKYSDLLENSFEIFKRLISQSENPLRLLISLSAQSIKNGQQKLFILLKEYASSYKEFPDEFYNDFLTNSFVVATTENNIPIMRLIISYGFNPTTIRRGLYCNETILVDALLFIALRHGSLTMVKLLIESGLSPFDFHEISDGLYPEGTFRSAYSYVKDQYDEDSEEITRYLESLTQEAQNVNVITVETINNHERAFIPNTGWIWVYDTITTKTGMIIKRLFNGIKICFDDIIQQWMYAYPFNNQGYFYTSTGAFLDLNEDEAESLIKDPRIDGKQSATGPDKYSLQPEAKGSFGKNAVYRDTDSNQIWVYYWTGPETKYQWYYYDQWQ